MSSPSDSKLQDSWTCFKGSYQRTGRSNSAFLRKPTFRNMIKVGPVLSSPVSDNQSVYVGTITGRVYRIDRESLVVKWHVNASNPVVSSPSIYNDQLIVGTFSKWAYEQVADSEPSSVSSFSVHDGPRTGSMSSKTEYFHQSVLSKIFMLLDA